MYRSLAVNDAGEAEDIQERVQRKKKEDAQEGKTHGGRRRYGYSKVIGHDPKKNKDICDPYQVRDEEVAVLQEGKRRTLAGDSQFTIMSDRKTRNITTADGHPWRVGPFKRALLNESYVQFDPTGHPTDCPCLQNPATGGTRTYYNERHRAKWPHLFTRAEHEAMKAIFKGRDLTWNNMNNPRARSYLLTGITYCGGDTA